MYVVVALFLVLVVAVVIKPILTGQPVNTGIPVPTTQQPTVMVTPPNNSIVTSVITTVTTSPTPTPVPTWGGEVTGVQFVNPSTYGLSMNEDASRPQGTRINEIPQDLSMTTYATISGQYSGTTQVIYVPFPYWELSYTVDPAVRPAGGSSVSKVEVLTTSGIAETGLQGVYSSLFPSFTLQVMDGDDPNRIARAITPPGGLDTKLWGTDDPRPWMEKFYEGQRNYYFIINARYLNSYNIDIRVPTKDVGKY